MYIKGMDSFCLRFYDLYRLDIGIVPTVLYVMCFIIFRKSNHSLENLIGGVMVSVLASSVVDCRGESGLGQTKDYKIG